MAVMRPADNIADNKRVGSEKRQAVLKKAAKTIINDSQLKLADFSGEE